MKIPVDLVPVFGASVLTVSLETHNKAHAKRVPEEDSRILTRTLPPEIKLKIR